MHDTDETLPDIDGLAEGEGAEDLSDSEKDELAELLAQATGQTTNDELPDLDALLAGAMEAKAEDEQVRVARERLKRGGRAKEEVDADVALIRKWEAARIWEPCANVAVFDRYTCECGTVNTIFSHMMQQRRMRTNHETLQLIQSDEMLEHLPNLLALQHFEVGMCRHCAPNFGFDLKAEPDILL